jgi:hypothetical protein
MAPGIAGSDEAIKLRRRIEAAVSNEEESAELKCWFASDNVTAQHLERFLQTAREDKVMKNDVPEGAFKISMKALRMRVENRIRFIFDDDFFPEGFEDLMVRTFGFQVSGIDAIGLPFIILDLGKLDTDLLGQALLIEKDKVGLSFAALWYVRMLEYIGLEVNQERSRKKGELVYATHTIFYGDFKWRLAGSAMRQWVPEIAQAGADLFPLVAGILTCMDTPWIGAKGFSMAKPYLDPVTVEKTRLLSSADTAKWKAEVDPAHLPLFVGGRAPNLSPTFQSRYPGSPVSTSSRKHQHVGLTQDKKSRTVVQSLTVARPSGADSLETPTSTVWCSSGLGGCFPFLSQPNHRGRKRPASGGSSSLCTPAPPVSDLSEVERPGGGVMMASSRRNGLNIVSVTNGMTIFLTILLVLRIVLTMCVGAASLDA